LSTHACLQGASVKRPRIRNKGEAQIPGIAVSAADHALVDGKRVLELHKALPVLVQMQIGVNLEALQQVSVAGVATHAEAWIVQRFDPLAQIDAQ
jgi:hypothetical protein